MKEKTDLMIKMKELENANKQKLESLELNLENKNQELSSKEQEINNLFQDYHLKLNDLEEREE